MAAAALALQGLQLVLLALAGLLVALFCVGSVQLALFRWKHPQPTAPAVAEVSKKPVAPRQPKAHHHVCVDGTVRLRDGRLLGFRDHRPVAAEGTSLDDDAAVLFYLHGLMGSRLEFFGYRSEFAARPVRIIAVDRPGYGLSSYSERRRLVDFADDLLELADQLHIARFAVVGWSSGGCYALACAARIPKTRLVSVGTISSDPQWKHTPWKIFPLHHKMLAFVVWNVPFILTPFFGTVLRLVLPLLAMADKRLLQRVLEANRFSIRATTKEMVLERSEWGFRLQDIARPVTLFHGDKDVMVPYAASEHISSKVAQATLHRAEGQGHGIASTLWGPIVAELTRNV